MGCAKGCSGEVGQLCLCGDQGRGQIGALEQQPGGSGSDGEGTPAAEAKTRGLERDLVPGSQQQWGAARFCSPSSSRSSELAGSQRVLGGGEGGCLGALSSALWESPVVSPSVCAKPGVCDHDGPRACVSTGSQEPGRKTVWP